ncbi:MAG: hypothetical protein Q4F07_01750 [Bacteroidales bacterium]|nr:hypothetical protein [Bacteroidales bacterium]
MVFNFRLVSDEVDNFKREIQIDSEATFLDLRDAICESVGYDKNEMSSFFLCDKGWEKEKEITLEDMGTDSDEDAYIMEECILSDYIDDEGQRLMFTFDYINDRSFFLEMKEMITGRELRDPLCTLALGAAPKQFVEPENIFEKAKPAKGKQATLDDFDDPLYEEEGYNPDEFDEEGFSELTFDD